MKHVSSNSRDDYDLPIRFSLICSRRLFTSSGTLAGCRVTVMGMDLARLLVLGTGGHHWQNLAQQLLPSLSSGNLAAFQGDMELAAALRAMLTKARMGQMRYIRRERLTPLASSTFLTASA